MQLKASKSLLILGSILIIVFSCFIIGTTVFAQGPNIGINYANSLGLPFQENVDPRVAAVNIVKYLMTFLGIIAVVVILFGGFKWMTAGGNEDRVADAKKLIVAGIIGLIIVLAAFAIVQFIVSTTTNLLSGGNM